MAAPPVTHIAESSTQPQEPEPYVPPPQGNTLVFNWKDVKLEFIIVYKMD